MAKQSRDDGQKKLKKNVQVTPNVVAENHRTIRRPRSTNRYFFWNRPRLVSQF